MIATVINGRYRVLEKVPASGQVGAYLAKDLQASRLVVVTEIPLEWAEQAGFAQRLRRGARLLGKLDSPYASRLLDFGDSDGTSFIVQEHVPGRNLGQLLHDDGPLDLERSVVLIRQVAQFLADIDSLGLFHGNLQPANIMFTKNETVKVMDLGLAVVRDWTRPDSNNPLAASSVYQSPEMATGQVIDIRTDVYSLGVILFELLMGHTPDPGLLAADPAALRRELAAKLGVTPKPRSLTSGAPASVSSLIVRCVAQDPAQRYAPSKVAATIAALFGVEPLGAGQEENLAGRFLGQYQLVEVIDSGGMASVYKAYQSDLDRYVAVKVLDRNLSQSPDFAARFHREAHAIAQLEHPNILPVYDFGQASGLAYIVMKYVAGRTLTERLGHPLPLSQAVEFTSQVAAALDHAHQCGVIHRDVKPGNVLIASEHWVLLSDFGLARVIDSRTRISRTGESLGTPAYISPEQGQGLPVDARSDVYSLGVTLYEMLTGQVPYDAETPMAVVLKHISAPLPCPREVNPEIPEAVEQVVLTALAKKPDARYQSAGALACALKLAVESSLAPHRLTTPPVLVVPAAVPSQKQRLSLRPVALVAICLLALVLMTGLVWVALLRTDQRTPSLAIWPGTALPRVEVSVPSTAQPVPNSAPGGMSPVDTLVPPLAALLPELPPVQPRIGLDNATQLASVYSLIGHLQQPRSLAFSPDGQTLASGAEDRTVRLWRVSDGAMINAMEGHTAAVSDVAFSPDGQTLASASEDFTVRLWRVSDGALLRTFQHPTGVLSVSFSPDGQFLASGALDRNLRLWRVKDGQLLSVLPHQAPVLDVTFAPDGQTLASSEATSGAVRLWRVSDGSLLRVWTGHNSDVTSIAFSPDGHILASAGGKDNTVRLWKPDDGSPLRVLSHPSGVSSVAFAPDGKILASSSSDNTLRLWRVSDGSLLVMLSENAPASTPAPPPQTPGVAIKAQVHGALPGTHPQQPVLSGRALAFSSSGTALASIAPNNTVRLWAIK